MPSLVGSEMCIRDSTHMTTRWFSFGSLSSLGESRPCAQLGGVCMEVECPDPARQNQNWRRCQTVDEFCQRLILRRAPRYLVLSRPFGREVWIPPASLHQPVPQNYANRIRRLRSPHPFCALGNHVPEGKHVCLSTISTISWFSPFFPAAKAFFRALSSAWHSEDPSVHYSLRMGLARRRWCVYWPPKVAGTGSIFRGCESEPKKSR